MTLSFSPSASLPAGWYERPVQQVAGDLLGCVLVSERPEGLAAGRIVEAEAYGDEGDPASHASFRRNGLVRAMWGAPGTLYVYRAYGVYPCLNVVCGPLSEPAGVLIRAIEPLAGAELMARWLGKPVGPRLASGPGLVGRALGGTTAENGHVLDHPPLWIQPGDGAVEVVSGSRIGVSRGQEHLWRFGIVGHPALSKPFRQAG